MCKEVAHGILIRIADLIGHRLPVSAHLRLRNHVGIAHDRFRRLPIRRGLRRGKFVGVSLAGHRIKQIGHASRRMIQAIPNRENRKDQKRADLNHVNGNVYRRRACNTSVCDVRDPQRKQHCNHHLEHRSRVGGAHEVGIQRANDVTAEDPRHCHHHTRIDPVVKMRRPPDDKLR